MSSVDDDAYCVRFNSDMDIDEQEEALLDPSNPLAHAVKAHLHGASLEHGKAKVVVGNDDAEVDSSLEELSLLSSENNRLSRWASRFLTPRKHAVLVELPIEPLNDYILKDFGTKAVDLGMVASAKEDMSENESSSEVEESNNVGIGTPLTASTVENGDTIKSTKKSDRKPKSSSKKLTENRYFRLDVSTRCFNCGEVGHMSGACVNDRQRFPCYYCAKTGHEGSDCPNQRCWVCFLPGHSSHSCPNQRANIEFCKLCGRIDHDAKRCFTRTDGFNDVRCMACNERGHSCCAIPPPSKTGKLFCPNCAENHSKEECRGPKENPVSRPRHYKTTVGPRNQGDSYSGPQRRFEVGRGSRHETHSSSHAPSRSGKRHFIDSPSIDRPYEHNNQRRRYR